MSIYRVQVLGPIYHLKSSLILFRMPWQNLRWNQPIPFMWRRSTGRPSRNSPQSDGMADGRLKTVENLDDLCSCSSATPISFGYNQPLAPPFCWKSASFDTRAQWHGSSRRGGVLGNNTLHPSQVGPHMPWREPGTGITSPNCQSSKSSR